MGVSIMGITTTYELLSFKSEKWALCGIFDKKEDATNEARVLLSGRHAKAVKIIAEYFDNESNKASARIVFRDEKGADRAGNKRRPPSFPLNEPARKRRSVQPAARTTKAPAKKESLTGAIIKTVFILGGIGLGMVGLLTVYVQGFGG